MQCNAIMINYVLWCFFLIIIIHFIQLDDFMCSFRFAWTPRARTLRFNMHVNHLPLSICCREFVYINVLLFREVISIRAFSNQLSAFSFHNATVCAYIYSATSMNAFVAKCVFRVIQYRMLQYIIFKFKFKFTFERPCTRCPLLSWIQASHR